MDPDETLDRLRLLVSRNLHKTDNGVSTSPDEDEFAELVEALDGWLSNGGFLPRAWVRK